MPPLFMSAAGGTGSKISTLEFSGPRMKRGGRCESHNGACAGVPLAAAFGAPAFEHSRLLLSEDSISGF